MMKSNMTSPEVLRRLKEYNARKSMALNVFRPLPHQEPIFRDYAKELLVRGGNRCSVAGTEVWTCEKGVGSGSRATNYKIKKIEELRVNDTIVGMRHGKRVDLCCTTVTSTTSFRESALELTTKRGYKLSGTHDH